MLELLIGIYFSYKNALIAKAKGLNTVIWVVLTLLAFIAGGFVGCFILIGLFYKGPFNENSVNEVNSFLQQLKPLNLIFVSFSAVGGCLFIRYRLEQKQGILPPKAENEESDQAD